MQERCKCVIKNKISCLLLFWNFAISIVAEIMENMYFFQNTYMKESTNMVAEKNSR